MGSSPITGSEDLVDRRIYKVFFFIKKKIQIAFMDRRIL